MIRTGRAVLRSLSLALAAAATAVAAQPGSDADFLAARDAFHRGQAQVLERFVARLSGHPLEGYAQMWQLRLRLDAAEPAEVQAFLARHSGTLVAERLRADWLRQLGRRQQWELFAAERAQLAAGSDAELDCHTLQQRRLAGDFAAAGEGRALWLTGRELPEACTPLFQALAATGEIASAEVWQRVRLALEAGNTGLALRAAAFLPAGVQPDARALALAAENPQAFLERRQWETKTRAGRETVLFAVQRLARTAHHQSAAALWKKIDDQFPPADRAYGWGQIAAWAARRHDPDALVWYRRAAAATLSDETLAWRVRAALRAAAWPDVLEAIERMSARERDDPAWRYWRARALRETGRTEEGTLLLIALARDFGFYGKLAQEDLGTTIGAPPPAPYQPDAEAVAAAGRNPSIQRALAFYRLGLRGDGNREWLFAIRGSTDQQFLAFAEFARRNQIWDRAISTAERTREMHDFTLRFVAPFRAELAPHLKHTLLDEAWVFGLIRQESRFIVEARSSAGASGLMQLMPATAAWVAKRLGKTDFRQSMINDIQTNLALGTFYLRTVLDELDGSAVLATAAYNAGPGRPRLWRGAGPMESAVFAETIPFAETRDYVKRVLSNSVWYAHLFGASPTSLRQRLGTIPARGNAPPRTDIP
jgi:soluble lytic murein transglycosylase